MPNTTYIRKWAFVALGMCGYFGAIAQNTQQDKGDKGFDQTQVITGDRVLKVGDTYKISTMPSLYPTKGMDQNLKYSLIPRTLPVSIPVDTIKPARLHISEPLAKLYKNYLKAGIGTYLTPFFEFHHSSLRDRDWVYDVDLKHMSANKGIKDVGYSGYSDNLADINFKRFMNHTAISGNLGYQHNGVHFYGFDPQDRDVSKKDISQHFNKLEAGFGLKSYEKDSTRLNYNAKLNFYNLGTNTNASETNFNLNSKFQQIMEGNYLQLDFGLDVNSYKAQVPAPFAYMNRDVSGYFPAGLPDTTQGSGILRILPHILKKGKNWKVDVGLSINSYMTNSAKFYFFPEVEASYSFFDNVIVPYAGLTGKVKRNSLASLTDENPFILTYFDPKPTIQRLTLYGGFKGYITQNLSYNLYGQFGTFSAMPLFVNDTLLSTENRFSVIHDNINELKLKGELDFRGIDKLQLYGAFTYYHYQMDKEAEAWQLPPYVLELQGKYNLYDKLLVGVKVTAEGKRKAKSLMSVPNVESSAAGYTIVDMKGFADVALTAEYRYTTRLSVFLEASNLLASKYQRWYRFPVQRALVIGGASYRF